MRAGDLVRFKAHEQAEWSSGLLLRYDKYLKIGEILVPGAGIFYAPGSLMEVMQRGKR